MRSKMLIIVFYLLQIYQVSRRRFSFCQGNKINAQQTEVEEKVSIQSIIFTVAVNNLDQGSALSDNKDLDKI